MNIVQSFITRNDCYRCGAKFTPKGLMLHSVGCNQPRAEVFVRNYNVPNYSVAVHAFIDGNTGTVYQTLPWTMRGWHAGGAANDTHIGIEMCEPSTIRYTGGASWVETSDGVNTRNTMKTTYNAAVELFAYLCKQFNLNPLKDGVIISHHEGDVRGVASSHADPEHIWNKIGGFSMNQFRKDVAAKMNGTIVEEPSQGTSASVLYKVQVGAFANKTNAHTMSDKLKKAGFDAVIINSNNLYKVQIGAYSNKANASTQVNKLKAAGFESVAIIKEVVTLGINTTPRKEAMSESEFVYTYKYSEWVKNLQSVLKSKGLVIAVDGIAGPKTYAILKNYTITSGDSGELTRCVQVRLNDLGFNCGTADGIAGPKTMSAIASFQKANGLGEGYLGGTDWYYLIR